MNFLNNTVLLLFKYGFLMTLLSCAWFLGTQALSYAWIGLMVVSVLLGQLLIKQRWSKVESAPLVLKNVRAEKDQTTWLSEVFLHLWPHTKSRVEEFMRSQLQQSVRKQLPSTLHTFTLTDIQLGNKVPKVLAVAVRDGISDCVTLDMEIIYEGDAVVGFSIGRLCSSIQSVQVHGTLRVVLTDLYSAWPFFGNINVSFLTQPAFSFTLSKSASVFNIVGFRDIIHECVVTQLNKIFVLPNFLTVPVVPEATVAPLYPLAQGVLRIIIHCARGLVLEQKDYIDPYCTVQVGASRYRSGVLQKTTNPKWDEVFEFIVDDKERQYVEIECVDSADTVGSGSLGMCNFSIISLIKASTGVVTVPLEKTVGGCITVSAVWLELSSLNTDLQRMRPSSYGCKALSTSVLSVSVHSAKDLPKGLRSIRQPSSYSRLSIGNEVVQTSVVQTTVKPVWREHFYFLVNNHDKEELQIEVIDDLTDTCLGKTAISLRDLLTATSDNCIQWYTLHNYRDTDAAICLGLRLKALAGGNLMREQQLIVAESSQPANCAVDGETTPRTVSSPVSSTPTKEALLKRQATSPTFAIADNGSSSGHSDILDFDNWSEMESNVIAGGSTYIVISRPDGSTVSEIVQNPPTAEDTVSDNEYAKSKDSSFGKMQITLRYSTAQQKLLLVVHQCCNLMPIDQETSPDPFVVLTLYNNKSKVDRKKTKHQKNTVNPVFDETFDFKLNQSVLDNAYMELRIKNRRGIFHKGKGDMGSVLLNIHALDLSEARTDWFLIQKLKGSTESLVNKSQNKSGLNRTQSFGK